MSTQPIAEPFRGREESRTAGRCALLVSLLGPLTALVGVVWAIVQPYRITLLHPHGESFWWLAVEPPLLVIAAAAAFHFLVARPLVRDLEELP
jgi:hypothetical protein